MAVQAVFPVVQDIQDKIHGENVDVCWSEINNKIMNLVVDLDPNEELKMLEHIASVIDGFIYLKDNGMHGHVTARRVKFKGYERLSVNAVVKKRVGDHELMTSETKVMDQKYNL